jgi:ribulose-5-phosphate 4-epimerase/fuculose-1-phosphate aldolase
MERGAVIAQLADAIRMLAHADLVDYSGHASVRRGDASFYINSGASIRSTLTAADIVAVDLDGQPVAGSKDPAFGEGAPANTGQKPPLEFPLHAEIYRARREVCAIVHTHPKWSTLLTMVGTPFRPVYPQGALLGDVPVLESPLSINTREMGARVADVLGARPAALLKSHGAVIVGADLVECFALAVYLEENASRQYLAMQIGTPYVLSDAEQEACRLRLGTPALYRKAWDHFRAKVGPIPG